MLYLCGMKNKKEAVIVDTPTEASQTQEQNKPTVKSVPVEMLAKTWFETEPERVTDASLISRGLYFVYGSKNLTKMITFLKTIKFTKKDMDYWMDSQKFPVSRNSDELYEDYKIRQKFQAALLKYRREVSSFAIMNTLQDFMDEQKAKKEEQEKQEIKEQNKDLKDSLEKSITE